jgi:hypothetical protein
VALHAWIYSISAQGPLTLLSPVGPRPYTPRAVPRRLNLPSQAQGMSDRYWAPPTSGVALIRMQTPVGVHIAHHAQRETRPTNAGGCPTMRDQPMGGYRRLPHGTHLLMQRPPSCLSPTRSLPKSKGMWNHPRPDAYTLTNTSPNGWKAKDLANHHWADHSDNVALSVDVAAGSAQPRRMEGMPGIYDSFYI